jgi:auxin efflux carrier family protein
MAPTGILESLVAAIQASLSVLLVLFYGGVASHLNLLDGKTGKVISKICVKMFLPALLLVKLGSEMQVENASRYGVIVLWGLICHFVSFLIGIGGHYLFGFPDWTTAAIMFNNTASYPLLLIQSLDQTGLLSGLIVTNETTRQALERAKSYFLVFSTISSCLTFAIGPRLIDTEHAPEDRDEEPEDSHGEENGDENSDANESTGLLGVQAIEDKFRRGSVAFFPSRPQNEIQGKIFNRRPSVVTKRRWLKLSPRTRWWLLFLLDFLNAPLIGALIGAFIGLIPALHRAFFADTQDGGIFTAWLTSSLQTIAQLFVPLPVLVAGVSLFTSIKQARYQDSTPQNSTPWLTTLFILVVRFVLWPVISTATIYGLAKHTNILGDDPMLWFTMALMPTGPSAMKLITMIQVSYGSAEEEQKIAKLLTASPSIPETF